MSREDANMFKGFCFRIKFKESGTKKKVFTFSRWQRAHVCSIKTEEEEQSQQAAKLLLR